MTVIYLVQHAEKNAVPMDPGLTERGRLQATVTGIWAGESGVQTLITSPLQRARETAGFLAVATGLMATVDPRARERMNWDGTMPRAAFVDQWAETIRDRDFVPAVGDSSRAAGERLRALVADATGMIGPVAVVTHGGVTVDLLRTLLGHGHVDEALIRDGIPPCAITTLDGTSVISIASVAHLHREPPEIAAAS